MNCIANRDPRRELFNTLKKETNLFFDSMLQALPPGGDSHMKQTGILVGNFEFNP